MTTPILTTITPVVHQHRLKIVTFTLATVDYTTQLNSWTVQNNTALGTKTFTYAGDSQIGLNSEFRLETDNDYSLALKFFADWRSGGISDFLIAYNKQYAAFQLDHHPNYVGEHVRWSGTCYLWAPSVGGDVRITEETTVTMPILGLPTYTRIG
jgi:hypothetical protein